MSGHTSIYCNKRPTFLLVDTYKIKTHVSYTPALFPFKN